jgi:hypothetical protein
MKESDIVRDEVQTISMNWPDRSYQEMLLLGDHKLRIHIKCDPYPAQAYARIQRWDGAQWQELHTLKGTGGMLSSRMLAKRGIMDGDVIREDREELIRIARIVVS